MSGNDRLCCKSRKLQGHESLAKTRSGKQSPIPTDEIGLSKSPFSLTSGDEAPHILTRKSRLQPLEFLIISAKRLLQHNRPQSDMRPDVVARHLRSHYSSTRAMRGGLRDEKGRPLRAGKRKAPAWDWGAWGWGFQLRGRTQHYTNATCHPDTGLSGLPRCSANRGW